MQAGDDGGEHPDRPGAEHDDRPRQRERAEPERVDAGGERLGQHRELGVEPVVDEVDAAHRHGDELAEAARPRAADELAVLADVLRARSGSSRQTPHGTCGFTATRRPTSSSPPAAAATTSPTSSCPMISGGARRGLRVATPWTSLPQIPARSTRISTSPSRGDRRLHVEDVERALQRVDEGAHRVVYPHQSTSICA